MVFYPEIAQPLFCNAWKNADAIIANLLDLAWSGRDIIGGLPTSIAGCWSDPE
jgi:hypothetical protein